MGPVHMRLVYSFFYLAGANRHATSVSSALRLTLYCLSRSYFICVRIYVLCSLAVAHYYPFQGRLVGRPFLRRYRFFRAANHSSASETNALRGSLVATADALRFPSLVAFGLIRPYKRSSLVQGFFPFVTV